MKVQHNYASHPPTLFPASLLKDGQYQHQLAARSASSGYLLISTLNNPKQTRLIRQLGRSLQRRGIKVSMLSV